jgi:hypothetical protein
MAIAAIRYNNPFNISLPRAGYYGGSVVGIVNQPGYAQFSDMATGYAAGAQRVTDYVSGNTSYGNLNTLSKLGNIYAEGPQGGQVWANAVSQFSGIPVNARLDPNNAEQMQALDRGILSQEVGPQNATAWTNQYGGGNSANLAQNGPADASSGVAAGNNTASTSGENIPGTGVRQPQQTQQQAAGAGGGIAIDLQTLGAGTTKPITDWIKTIMTGFGGMATTIYKAAENLGANAFGGITNWFERAFLMLLGIILIAVGLIVLMWDHGGEQVAAKVTKFAAA